MICESLMLLSGSTVSFTEGLCAESRKLRPHMSANSNIFNDVCFIKTTSFKIYFTQDNVLVKPVRVTFEYLSQDIPFCSADTSLH